MNSSASQASPPAPGTLPEKPPAPETSTPNQVKNMNMKSRTAEIAAIFSPVFSLSDFHLHIPPWWDWGRSDPTPAAGRKCEAGGRSFLARQRRRSGRAASRVLTSSIAIVIGPTPPGTGVIAAATSRRPPRSRRRRQRPASPRLMPTSITTAPGLTISAPTSRGDAHRGDQHVGLAADRGEVAGARVAHGHRRVGGEQQRARAACRPASSGRRRPPRAPSSSTPAWRSSSITPAGVQGRPAPGMPWASRPALSGVSPSTSLAGSIARPPRRGRAARAGEAGRGCRRPRSSSPSARTSSSNSSSARRRRAPVVEATRFPPRPQASRFIRT